MRTALLLVALLAGQAFAVDAIHPIVELIHSQPAALESVTNIAEIGVQKPDLFLKGMAALSQAAPNEADHLNAASGASVAVLALAANPRLAAQAGLAPKAAEGLANISQSFQKLAAEQPSTWGRVLERAKAVDVDASQSLDKLGPKLLALFDGEAARPADDFPRIKAYLERFDGPEALVVIEKDGRSELRELDAERLRKAGVRDEKQMFLMNEDGSRISASRIWRITSMGVWPSVRAQDIALIKKDPRVRLISQEGATLIVESTLSELHPYSDLFTIKLAKPDEGGRQLTLQTREGPVTMPVLDYPDLASVTLEAGSGLKIEVGPGDRPLPGGFIKVDKHARDGLGHPNAVLDGGIIADAKALPFEDGSAAVIASKHFGWFGDGKQDLIVAVLKEYKRALKSGGLAILLVDSRRERADIWREHAAIAFLLGYEVSFVRVDKERVEGLLLRKP